MRYLIVLCLIAVTWADQLGYNYQPVGHSNSGLSFTPGSDSISSGLGAINRGAGINYGIGSIGGVGPGGVSNGPYDVPSYAAPAELQNEFYTYSAPEHEFDDGHTGHKVANNVKQGLRVIFIKGPENKALENAAVSLAKQAVEQKTAVYVLNKQVDIGDLTNKLNVIKNDINHKPEVHFVKYRTPEDAENAQKAIQNQYESLGGISQFHNGGVAPVLNFASQAPVHSAPIHTPANTYLPSSVFRSF